MAAEAVLRKSRRLGEEARDIGHILRIVPPGRQCILIDELEFREHRHDPEQVLDPLGMGATAFDGSPAVHARARHVA